MLFRSFNLVGAMGAVLQSTCLALLIKLTDIHYIAASGLAVEAAILHNFAWHALWTFSDRMARDCTHAGSVQHAVGWENIPRSFAKYQLQAGAVSIPGNLSLMWLFSGVLHVPLLPANLACILACSWANYYLADRFSFRHAGGTGVRAAG